MPILRFKLPKDQLPQEVCDQAWLEVETLCRVNGEDIESKTWDIAVTVDVHVQNK